jgi:3-deoxy-D-manno-octulosonate 8-phosphate phosphatase (KDO 8-P phosphatase)
VAPVKGDGLESRLAERLRPVRLLVLDVDGTLTDNVVEVSEHGESLRFCVADGLAIKELQKAGVEVAWISGRGSPATAARAGDLGVRLLRLKTLAKGEAALEIARGLRVAVHETAGMGDDLPDLSLRAACGFLAAPANARPEVAARADHVTRAAGGAGAVRELAELILRAQGRWAAIVAGHGG